MQYMWNYMYHLTNEGGITNLVQYLDKGFDNKHVQQFL
jgi:hypothetical protein